MIFDFDDYEENNHRLDLLERLHHANPAFRCTLFAVPGNSSPAFWRQTPEWCELALHGQYHPHPREAENWSYAKAMSVLEAKPDGFVDGWKSPGWQISDGTYEALEELGWWVADQPYNDSRRPVGLRVHRLGDGDGEMHVHGHIQDIGTNGLQETFPMLLELVARAKKFTLVSEAVQVWEPVMA